MASAGCRRRLAAIHAVVDGDGAQIRLAVGCGEVEHQPRRMAVVGVHDERLVDAYGLGEIEHQAGAALHHQTKAERLDQATAAFAGLRRELEGHLWDVDDDTVGIGKRECVQVDLAGQIHDEADLIVVAAEPHVARDRIGVGCRRRRR